MRILGLDTRVFDESGGRYDPEKLGPAESHATSEF